MSFPFPRPDANPAGPDYRRGYLRVPLPVWLEVFCRAPLTRRQLQLVAAVIRESWGWQRDGRPYLWTRPLPPARFAELTGLSTDRISRDLRALVDRGVLRERDCCYAFVPDSSEWLAPAPGVMREDGPSLAAAEPASAAADPALPPGGVKTAHTEQRDEAFEAPAPLAVPSSTDRFVRVLLGFVGPLPPSRWQELRRWVERVGAAAVWRELEPGFRRGPATARLLLAAALDAERRRMKEGRPPSEPPTSP